MVPVLEWMLLTVIEREKKTTHTHSWISNVRITCETFFKAKIQLYLLLENYLQRKKKPKNKYVYHIQRYIILVWTTNKSCVNKNKEIVLYDFIFIFWIVDLSYEVTDNVKYETQLDGRSEAYILKWKAEIFYLFIYKCMQEI